MQVDAGQLSAKIASRGDQDFHLRRANGILIGVWISEGADNTVQHCSALREPQFNAPARHRNQASSSSPANSLPFVSGPSRSASTKLTPPKQTPTNIGMAKPRLRVVAK